VIVHLCHKLVSFSDFCTFILLFVYIMYAQQIGKYGSPVLVPLLGSIGTDVLQHTVL